MKIGFAPIIKYEYYLNCLYYNTICKIQNQVSHGVFFPSFSRYNIQCHTAESANDILVPSFDEKRKHCVFQGDLLLFSCAGSHLNHKRICPCRDYLKGQVALCKDCLQQEVNVTFQSGLETATLCTLLLRTKQLSKSRNLS